MQEHTPPPGAAGSPGWLAAIFDRGGVRRTWCWGWADLASGRPMSPLERLRWFSVTKIVVATAALRLVDRGLLSLEEPVVRHLPWLREIEGAERITASHLLGHCSGLPDPSAAGWVHPPGGRRRDGAQLARALAARARLVARPGAELRYTNLGYLVLGQLLAHLSAEPLADHLRAAVLAPAGMADTSLEPTPAAAGHERLVSLRAPVMAALFAPRTLGLVRYVRDGYVGLAPFELDGEAYGGLVGPLSDLIRLGRLHLNDGALDGATILSPGAAARMRQPCSRGPDGQVGLGWWLTGDGWVGHGGEAGGYRSELQLCPGAGVGLAVLANCGAATTAGVAARLRRLVLDASATARAPRLGSRTGT